MRLLCTERDRLWEAYDRALNRYIQAVNQVAAHYRASVARAETVAARITMGELREEIRAHCCLCGCDPDWMAMQAKPRVVPIRVNRSPSGA